MERHLHWFSNDSLCFAMSSAKNHSVFVLYPKPISSKDIPSLRTSSFCSQLKL
jgi:hypothetical protein